MNSTPNNQDRQMEERLNQQIRFTQELINAIPNPVFYKDRVGHYVGCNQAFELFFGIGLLELTKQSICGNNPPQLSGGIHRQMEVECLATNEARRYDAMLLNGNGDTCYVQITVAPYLVDKGKSGGLLFTVTDISALKRNEESLKNIQGQVIQQEKLASIGQLAAGVAHEINNPMGFIGSNLTSLGKYADRLDQYIAALQSSLFSCPQHPDTGEIDTLRQKLKVDYIISDMRELINESLDGAARVRRIVQDLKSFSRLDQVEQCSASLNELLETTVNIAWNEIKYIATLEKQFGEIPEIVCYPQQLNQVFLNLLVNAAQAMEQQGVITVRTWSDAGAVYVSVADTGKGMTEEIRSRVFDPFYTTKPSGKGTGLGLAISSDIVNKHGGEISVASEVGKGTTFTVMLPMHRSTTRQEQADDNL